MEVKNKHEQRKNILWWINAHREVLKVALKLDLKEEIDFFSQRIKELKKESESL